MFRSKSVYNRHLDLCFRALRETELTWLRQLDAQLTEVEFSSAMDAENKRATLAKLKAGYIKREPRMEQVIDGKENIASLN